MAQAAAMGCRGIRKLERSCARPLALSTVLGLFQVRKSTTLGKVQRGKASILPQYDLADAPRDASVIAGAISQALGCQQMRQQIRAVVEIMDLNSSTRACSAMKDQLLCFEAHLVAKEQFLGRLFGEMAGLSSKWRTASVSLELDDGCMKELAEGLRLSRTEKLLEQADRFISSGKLAESACNAMQLALEHFNNSKGLNIQQDEVTKVRKEIDSIKSSIAELQNQAFESRIEEMKCQQRTEELSKRLEWMVKHEEEATGNSKLVEAATAYCKRIAADAVSNSGLNFLADVVTFGTGAFRARAEHEKWAAAREAQQRLRQFKDTYGDVKTQAFAEKKAELWSELTFEVGKRKELRKATGRILSQIKEMEKDLHAKEEEKVKHVKSIRSKLRSVSAVNVEHYVQLAKAANNVSDYASKTGSFVHMVTLLKGTVQSYHGLLAKLSVAPASKAQAVLNAGVGIASPCLAFAGEGAGAVLPVLQSNSSETFTMQGLLTDVHDMKQQTQALGGHAPPKALASTSETQPDDVRADEAVDDNSDPEFEALKDAF